MDTNTLRDTAQDASQPATAQKNELASAQATATATTQAIKLRLVNQSNDQGTSQILIFQRNVPASAEEAALAWRVIQNLAPGWSHPFTFSHDVEAQVQDAWGNVSPALPLAPGQAAEVVKTSSGTVFQLSSTPASDPNTQEVINKLSQGAISATLLRDDLPAAVLHGITPGAQAAFKLNPTIYIGVASQVQQGEVIDSAIISTINQEISLLGIASADIVMTGGGPGTSSHPFTFSLANVKFA